MFPCLSATPQKNIQSKWQTWFIRNTERRWNLPWWPKERILIPKNSSIRERGMEEERAQHTMEHPDIYMGHQQVT